MSEQARQTTIKRRNRFKLFLRKTMKTSPTSPKTVDAYVAGFPPDVQARLEKIRATIRKAAPDAQETIKYQIPTFTLKGNLISFAAYQNHIGLYPVPAGTATFQRALAAYKSAKSTVRLPLDEPLPLGLLRQLVKFRVKENLAKAEAKGKKK